MAVSTSPVKILLDLEIDLDNLSSEENYLSALIEATNILSISNSGDGRIPILQEEIKRVRGERVPAIKERRTRISAASLLGRSVNKEPQKLLSASRKMNDRKRMSVSSMGDMLSTIAEKIISIETTLFNEKKIEDKQTRTNRIKSENLKRDDEESRVEKVTKFLSNTSKKVIAPVQGIFSRIFNFLKVIFLGKIFLKLLGWFGNPENAKKIDSVVKFLGNNWGKLLAAYLVFGTGLGRFVQLLTKTVIRGAIALTRITAQLLAAKGVRGARGVFRATRGVKGGKLGAALNIVGTTAAVLGMGRMFQGDGSDVQEFSDGGQVSGVGNKDTVPAMLTPGEVVMSKGAVQKFGADNLLAMNAAGGGTGTPSMMGGVIGYNQGGLVDNRFSGFYDSGIESFKKDLQRLETRRKLSTLSLEKQAEIEKASQKSVSNYRKTKEKNFNNPLKRGVGGLADFMTLGMFDFDKRNRKGAPKDYGIRRIAGGLTDFLTLGLTDFDKRGAGIAQVNPISGGEDKAWGSRNEQAKRREKQSGFGLKRGIGGALDFATLGMFDFDKQNRRGAPKGFGPLRMLGGLADAITAGATDFDKRGAGIGQMKLGEMMSNKRDRSRMMKSIAERRGIPQTITTNRKVNGRFDMNTGKAYINNQEVPIEQYVNFHNMSMREKVRVYGQRYNKGGLVPEGASGYTGKDKKEQEAYMLKFVNEERTLQGLPPLKELTYAPNVYLTKQYGPGPRIKETSNSNVDLDRGITTKSKSRTVDGKTEFIAKIGKSTDEEKQKFFAENPYASQLVKIKNQVELDSLGSDISSSAKGYNEGGMVEKDYSGNLSLLGGRSLGSISDLYRFGGEDFIYKGLKKGITYNPAFTGAGPKALGGKKIMDMLPFGMGKNVPNYASQYFTPELDTAMRYAGEGGSIVKIPRTKGVRGFKNLFGSNISRGFDFRDVEQLVKTSDTIGLDKAGLTKTFDLSNKATKESLKNAALKQGSKKGLKKLLGRLVPGVSIGLSAMDAKDRLSRGDQLGAALSGVSAIPGPMGWLGLAAQLAYDATINPFNEKPKQMAKGGYTGPMTTPNIKAPVGQPTMSAPKVTVLPSRETVNSSGQSYGDNQTKIPQFNIRGGSSRKAKQLGIAV